MKLSVVDTNGKQVGQIEVDDAVFGIDPNRAVMHQALLAQRANRRQGTSSTLNRSGHSGSSQKTLRQKGSGRARQGTASSPLRRGGSVAHGPHPRSYRQQLPKRMRRLAIRSVLSQRTAEGGLMVLNTTDFEPRTRAVRDLLQALGVTRSALVVTMETDKLLQRGIRNLPNMYTCPADTLNVEALLDHEHVIMTEPAIRRTEALWGGARARLRRAPIPVSDGS